MKSSSEKDQSSGRGPLSVFVDANTLVSGLLFEGNEALLLKLGAVGACRLFTTLRVMTEVAQTLRAKDFRFTEDDIASLLSLAHRSVRVRENPTEFDLKRHYHRLNDKKDVHVVAAFEKLKCDVLVTGDKELLAKVPNATSTREVLKMILNHE